MNVFLIALLDLDSFNVKGFQATLGYVSFLTRPPGATNSVVVDILFDAGAVFYCKTNVPQSMMTAGSHNNVFGRTLNPNNLSLTAGGSTGGEGALLAMRGSLIGLATDIAGSNRIPALCNGTSSFKPTASRIPFAGGVPPGRIGSPSPILPVIGPAGHSIRDCESILKTVIDSKPWQWDDVVTAPWRRLEPMQKKLRFGLIRECKERPLHPPVARILHSAATALQSAGHSIVLLDGKVTDLWESTILAWKFFLLDPQKTAAKHVAASGEPWVPSIAKTQIEELTGWTATLDELFDMNAQRARIVKAYRDLMVGEKFDAILMCGYQATDVPHDTFGMLPYLKANKELDVSFFQEDAVYEPPYKPDTFEGMPGSVQIVGKPMEDEELVEVMRVVEDILTKAE